MPASRPIWKGQLRLSLVAIPVELFSAARPSAKPSFRQIHEPTGKPIHYEKVVAGVGPVDKDEIIKGFEYEKGDYVLLTDDEIDAVKLETRKTLELTQFVGACEIDPIFYDKSYFVVPTDELAEDAFRVIRDALRKTEKVGLGQLSMRGKEYLAAIKPSGTGLMLETLHYEEEIRKADPFFSQISAKKAEDDLLDVATALIDKKTAPFDAGAFKDHYQSALKELIQRKMKAKGRKITAAKDEAPERPSGENVVDLMAALKQSLEGGTKNKSTAKKPAASKPTTRKKAS
ncbi:Ku protein [Devosia sp. XJ19-1]|uniref:Non-homologous end joining protein Ku n=1 Tax=Devosia ureilytica TaxID=2952754 RepID=A0A9Q4AQP1_9HYPH|nr:Ku protein [Devosia ureilytica]MCP8884452.1 Ku protein [Devosia ureilytica]MCP8888060.1 Ku protein [Devosia ureilytica]